MLRLFWFLFLQILGLLKKKTEISIPQSMEDYELAVTWNNFKANFQTDEKKITEALGKEGKTKEDMLKEWKPDVDERIKTSLIIQKVIELEKIQTSDQEIDEGIQKQAENNNQNKDELKDKLIKNNLYETYRSNITRKKAVDFLVDNAKVIKSKKVKYLDLIQGNY